MAKPYGDDLRQKFFSAYDQGDLSLEKLAVLFHVSTGWAKKISAARNRTGKTERVPCRPGRKPAVSMEMHPLVKAWFTAQPDLTLAEVQAKLLSQVSVSLSVPQVWHLLRKLGLRLKKSRSTLPSATPRPTSRGARSL
jgi:transposase